MESNHNPLLGSPSEEMFSSIIIHGGHGGHGYLDGCLFLVAYGKKSFEEIFVKEWPEARNNLSLSQHEHNL